MKTRFQSLLYLVTDRQLAKKPVEVVVEEAIKGGADCVQLREKNIDTKEFVEIAQMIKYITDRYNVPLIINDRIDVALAVHAYGVHLGQDDMPLTIARKIVPHAMVIGISVSTVNEAIEAEKDGADYIGAGSVFPTSTKDDISGIIGLEGIQEIKKAVSIPVIAIGGIQIHNAEQVIQHGADGIAVVSAIVSSDNPYEAAKTLKTIICEVKSCY
ncbi:MAG TPA: thiamine phosphate synthase [Spirochaetota bacterium]|nr:thiamine phosphate synthase [Spirochaetota bacterium]HOM09171.1 thiamine phosphate synthase [Spirochaetota bacterium]HPP49136.1 thiamine phosphate synthase [Spirochaetota bacterium]